jgi:hypothetical protein
MGRISGKEIFDQRRFPDLDALQAGVACHGQHQIKLRFVAPVVHDFEGKLAHESLFSFIRLFVQDHACLIGLPNIQQQVLNAVAAFLNEVVP